jgi:SAM-dependent methyltransferase
MVEVCRRKFPEIPFVLADATSLTMFAEASFDAVVMAFNGFDYVMPGASRQAALSEIRRVLNVGGVFIFSSHNPRAIWQRPSWNPQRVEALAKRVAGSRPLVLAVVRGVLSVARIALALVITVAQSLRRLFRALVRRAFWLGEGYMHDVAHGGLMTHYAAPRNVERELHTAGFELLEVLGDDYPKRSHVFVTPWYYYVFKTSPLAAKRSEMTACK